MSHRVHRHPANVCSWPCSLIALACACWFIPLESFWILLMSPFFPLQCLQSGSNSNTKIFTFSILFLSNKNKARQCWTQGGTTEGAYAAAEAQTEGSFRGKDGERLTLPYAARFGPRKHVRTFFVIVRLFFRAAEGAGTNNDQQWLETRITNPTWAFDANLVGLWSCNCRCVDMQEEAGWQQEAPGEVDRDLSGCRC